MNRPPLKRTLTVLLATAGLALAATALPGPAAQADRPSPARALDQSRPDAARLAGIRARQQQMIAHHRPAPTMPRAGITTFTVNTIEDSTLADAMGTTCVDTTSGKCSLRAAVDAADNLEKPVKIVLGAKTYMLSTATELNVTNPAGTYIVGQGASKTVIQGAGSRVIGMNTTSRPALLSLTGVKVTAGMATKGAGIWMGATTAGSTLVLDRVVISGNTATDTGGGVYSDDYGTIYARNSRISGNQALFGAGFYSYWADVHLVGTSIVDNHTLDSAASAGAGLYTEYGVLRMVGGSISDNSAGNSFIGYGGGLLANYGNLRFNGVHIDKNVAGGGGFGGGAYLYEDLVRFDGGTISGNRSTGSTSKGGGIYIEAGAQVTLHGVTMAGNKLTGTTSAPTEGGGAVFAYGTEANQLTIEGGTKITGSNHSAIYAWLANGQLDLSIDHATISGNTAEDLNGPGNHGCGGAICVDATAGSALDLAVASSTFADNSSAGTSGGGAVAVTTETTAAATVSLERSTFRSNETGAGGYGGAMSLTSDSGPISVRMSRNAFTGNTAGSAAMRGWGGAVTSTGDVVLTDVGSRFVGNRALGSNASGGAVMADTSRSMRFDGSVFSGNSAGKGQSAGYGGAVYSDGYDGDSFTRVTMSGNFAASDGGAYYGGSGAYDVHFDSSTVSGNTAGSSMGVGRGGGIFVDDGILLLENSTVAGNTAVSQGGTSGKGGGVWASGSTFGLRYSTVSGNVAAEGGGIYEVALGGNFLASIVSGNRASKGGAAQDCTLDGPTSAAHSLGANVLGKASCVVATTSTDKVTTKPGVGPLKSNGGPTKTMALTKKSPAVGRASFLVPATDQRGKKRPTSKADAGAYELP